MLLGNGVCVGAEVLVGTGVAPVPSYEPPSKSSKITALLLVNKPICPARAVSNPAFSGGSVSDTTKPPFRKTETTRLGCTRALNTSPVFSVITALLNGVQFFKVVL